MGQAMSYTFGQIGRTVSIETAEQLMDFINKSFSNAHVDYIKITRDVDNPKTELTEAGKREQLEKEYREKH